MATNKFVLGHRTAAGWVVDKQTPLQVKPDVFYDLLIAVNGTAVTVTMGVKSLSHIFPARMIDGEAYGLNKGLIGIGSDQSRGVFDNISVQILPPQFTLDFTETFDDGLADLFDVPSVGAPWTIAAGSYSAVASVGATSITTLDFGVNLEASSYIELTATVKIKTAGAIGGVVFDYYGPNDFKFVALDVANQRVIDRALGPAPGLRGGHVRQQGPRAEHELLAHGQPQGCLRSGHPQRHLHHDLGLQRSRGRRPGGVVHPQR